MSQPATFWYVEDDVDDREILAEALAKACPQIHLEVFSSGEELIKKIPAYIGKSIPNLIILDLNIPGLTGKDVLPIIRAFSKFDKTKIAVLTTSGLPRDKAWAEEHGALFITKPFVFDGYDNLCKQLYQYAMG